ncbi:MAG TPA: YlzJ-like family protein [Bacillota bacterium]
MLLYTVVPEEFIFAQDQTDNSPFQPEVEIKMGGVSLLGQPLGNGRVVIKRIISSNSQDYLNPNWQPGMVL